MFFNVFTNKNKNKLILQYLKQSGYLSVTGRVLLQAIHPALNDFSKVRG